ncbi:MAG: hypothetical protein KatS3mg076_1029 [Candidatus Binatia bacterium]|nr:MAG: hypothetical protein KatS3mg076_1029 [Candidatus Binatia bacterium]
MGPRKEGLEGQRQSRLAATSRVTRAGKRLFFGIVGFFLVAGIAPSATGQPPVDPDEVVILARDFARFRRNGTVTEGAVVVNELGGTSVLHRTFEQLSGLFVSDAIRVRGGEPPGPKFWDLFVNTVLDSKNGMVVMNSGPDPIASGDFPILPYPTPAVVTPGSDNVVVRRNDGPVTLAPGAYDAIRVGRSGVLAFTGGTYDIRVLRVARNASVFFNSTTTLRIRDRLRVGLRSVLGPNPDVPTFNPRCIVYEVAGERRVRFGTATVLEGVISAPLARVVLQGVVATTSVTGREVVVGADSLLSPPPPASVCP